MESGSNADKMCDQSLVQGNAKNKTCHIKNTSMNETLQFLAPKVLTNKNVFPHI